MFFTICKRVPVPTGTGTVFSNKIKIHENLNKKTVTSTGSVVDPNNLNIWIRIQGYVFNLEKIVMKI